MRERCIDQTLCFAASLCGCPLEHPLTGDANAAVPPGLHQVVPSKPVPSETMGLRSKVPSRRIAAAHIFSLRHRFKVRRIDASGNAAEMIENASVGDRSLEMFVGESVGHHGMLIFYGKAAIAEAGPSSGPKPATGRWFWTNPIPESLFDRFTLHGGEQYHGLMW